VLVPSEKIEQWRLAFNRCLQAVQTHRTATGADLRSMPLDSFFAEARALYSQMTGAPDTHPNAIGHHRLALLGPPCPARSKPLRTPNAQFCAACGQPRGSV
jgi:hypothetical protein